MSLPEIHSVLFVEDDPDVQAVVRIALQEMHGVHLRICTSAREALQAAEDFPASLLLLDVMMPEIDGVTLLAGLRQKDLHRNTPVVFLTSLAHPDDVRYYRSLGITGVISKPFDPTSLGSQLAEIVANRDDADETPPAMTEELKVLQRVFERELPHRLANIRSVLVRCRVGPVTRQDCARLWELVEELRNAAHTFGHERIAREAMRIEQAAAALVLAPGRSLTDLLKIELGLLSVGL